MPYSFHLVFSLAEWLLTLISTVRPPLQVRKVRKEKPVILRSTIANEHGYYAFALIGVSVRKWANPILSRKSEFYPLLTPAPA